jgi:hypothetical protein
MTKERKETKCDDLIDAITTNILVSVEPLANPARASRKRRLLSDKLKVDRSLYQVSLKAKLVFSITLSRAPRIGGDFPALVKWMEKCKVTLVTGSSIFNSLW